MSKIIVNLTHSFHLEDLSHIEKLMKKDGYKDLNIKTSPELYQEYAEEFVIKAFLDFNKEELLDELSITSEIL